MVLLEMSLKKKLATAAAAGAVIIGSLLAAPAAHATSNPSKLDQGDLSIACKIQYGPERLDRTAAVRRRLRVAVRLQQQRQHAAQRGRQQLLYDVLRYVGDGVPRLLEVPGLLGTRASAAPNGGRGTSTIFS